MGWTGHEKYSVFPFLIDSNCSIHDDISVPLTGPAGDDEGDGETSSGTSHPRETNDHRQDFGMAKCLNARYSASGGTVVPFYGGHHLSTGIPIATIPAGIIDKRYDLAI